MNKYQGRKFKPVPTDTIKCIIGNLRELEMKKKTPDTGHVIISRTRSLTQIATVMDSYLI